MVVLDLDNVNVNTMYSTMKIHVLKDILSPGFRLLGMIRMLRADYKKHLIGGHGPYSRFFVATKIS